MAYSTFYADTIWTPLTPFMQRDTKLCYACAQVCVLVVKSEFSNDIGIFQMHNLWTHGDNYLYIK